MTQGPRRLLESDTGELAKSLRCARERLPSPERMAHLANRLAQAGVVLPPHAEAPSANSPEPAAAVTQPTGALVKAGLGLGGIGAAVLVMTLASRAGEPEPATAIQPRALSTASVSAADSASPATASSPLRVDGPGARAPTPRHSGPIRPEAAFETPAAPQPLRQRTTELAEPAATARSSRIASQSAPQSHAFRDLAAPAPTAVETSAGIPREVASEPPRDSEIELLKRARSAVTSDPQEALALARRHRTEYPRGAYAQERDVIAISALARLGRSVEANRLAEAFRERYPRSAYLPQVDRILGKAQ
ncbi:MAG TPA: hypothetical protein VIM73_09265 [Polyangiaceae bacterium]